MTRVSPDEMTARRDEQLPALLGAVLFLAVLAVEAPVLIGPAVVMGLALTRMEHRRARRWQGVA
ncbi:MAG: hypothetical protein H6739_21430 [Alphaproteobacteria bacterium]|nr:hypothetical protein [Alphaproteobacteria bacterium]